MDQQPHLLGLSASSEFHRALPCGRSHLTEFLTNGRCEFFATDLGGPLELSCHQLRLKLVDAVPCCLDVHRDDVFEVVMMEITGLVDFGCELSKKCYRSLFEQCSICGRVLI